LSGCAPDEERANDTTSLPASTATVESKQNLKLVIGVNEIFCKKTACKCVHHIATRAFGPLRERLRTKHRIELAFRYYPEDMFSLEDDAKAGKLDGVLAKPWSILKYTREAGRNYLRLVDLGDPDGKCDLHGLVIVKADSSIRDWSDLKDKRVALGQPGTYVLSEPIMMPSSRIPCAFKVVSTGIRSPPHIERGNHLSDSDHLNSTSTLFATAHASTGRRLPGSSLPFNTSLATPFPFGPFRIEMENVLPRKRLVTRISGHEGGRHGSSRNPS
jgi:hypothetical protein